MIFLSFFGMNTSKIAVNIPSNIMTLESFAGITEPISVRLIPVITSLFLTLLLFCWSCAIKEPMIPKTILRIAAPMKYS